MSGILYALGGVLAVVLCGAALWLAGRRRRSGPGEPRPLGAVQIHYYRLAGERPRYAAIVCGDLRDVRCAEVWVNSENTTMQMARFEEFSVSSIIRYEGASFGPAGEVLRDTIAEDLDRKVARRRPVPPATAISTDPGELRRFGVREVVHVAAVQGEPGAGFRQVREVGRCVAGALAEIDRDREGPRPGSVLVPLLGTGQGGGDLDRTVGLLLGAVVGYFRNTPSSAIKVVYMLAYTDLEFDTCRKVFSQEPCGTEVAALDHQWSGDGFIGLLPTDIDPTATLPGLLRSLVEHLAGDNDAASDRLRLRMAVGLGITGPGPTGFSGSMVVNLARLVDSPPLRTAAGESAADLVVMVSGEVFAQLIRPGYADLPAADFREVRVSVKELDDTAWLWIP